MVMVMYLNLWLHPQLLQIWPFTSQEVTLGIDKLKQKLISTSDTLYNHLYKTT